MQLFGLVAVWLTAAGGSTTTGIDENGKEAPSLYNEALDSAQTAADSMGGSVTASE